MRQTPGKARNTAVSFCSHGRTKILERKKKGRRQESKEKKGRQIGEDREEKMLLPQKEPSQKGPFAGKVVHKKQKSVAGPGAKKSGLQPELTRRERQRSPQGEDPGVRPSSHLKTFSL